MQDPDAGLATQDCIANDAFNVAYSTALVTIDFAHRGITIDMPEQTAHLLDWHQRVNRRPAIQAT